MKKIILTWHFFAFASAFFAALTAIFGKIGVSELNSNLATFFRTLVVLVISGLLITWRSEWIKPENISSKSLFFLFLSGLATGCSWLFYYRALQMGPASRVAPLDKLSVVFVIFFSVLFLGESLTWKISLGATFITIGAILMST